MTYVTLKYLGQTFYLRNTIWTAYQDRATEFADEAAARAGLEKAKQFMKIGQFRNAKIEKVA